MHKKRLPLFASALLVAALLVMTLAFVQAHPPAGTAVLPRANNAVQEDPPVDGIAQADPANDLTRVSLSLSSGFIMDPYLLRVVSGGLQEASSLDEACQGFIKKQPDVVIDWSGEAAALHLFTYSNGDAMLVVETPDGEFLCNDDADDVTVDALISIEEPQEGEYNIYAGSFRSEEPVMGFLIITEIDPVDEMAALDLTPLLDRRDYVDAEQLTPAIRLEDLSPHHEAVFGKAELSPGFESVEVFAAGGGDVNVAGLDGLDDACQGFVSLVPSYSVIWSGDGGFTAFFESEKNSAMGIVDPEGEVICNDNTAEENLNPLVQIQAAAEGEYDIYISSLGPDDFVTGQLTITNDSNAALAPLGTDE